MPSKKLTQAHFEQWMQQYKTAWEQFDVELALSLFSTDASYYETPFHIPITGHENLHAFWVSAPHYQRNVQFQFQIISFKGTTGYCKWKATYFQWATGEMITLDGFFEVHFASDGHCSELKSWWHRFAQLTEPYSLA